MPRKRKAKRKPKQTKQKGSRARRELVHFVESAKGFDASAKLRLVIIAAGLKPSTFVALRIGPENLDEKRHFEKHLRRAGLRFRPSRGRAFEEIESIKGNVVRWRIAGTWYGYDLFQHREAEKLFQKYTRQIRKNKHPESDLIGGQLYGYPHCCAIQFAKEHDKHWLAKHFTSYEYYKRAHANDRAFPFLTHSPCSPTCPASRKLHKDYERAVKKLAPRFYRAYVKPIRFRAKLIIDSYSDVYWEAIDGRSSIWPEKDGFEYALLCTKPIKGKFYLLAWLAKDYYEHGTVIEARVRVRYDYADVLKPKVIGTLPDLHHERKFPVQQVGAEP